MIINAVFFNCHQPKCLTLLDIIINLDHLNISKQTRNEEFD